MLPQSSFWLSCNVLLCIIWVFLYQRPLGLISCWKVDQGSLTCATKLGVVHRQMRQAQTNMQKCWLGGTENGSSPCSVWESNLCQLVKPLSYGPVCSCKLTLCTRQHHHICKISLAKSLARLRNSASNFTVIMITPTLGYKKRNRNIESSVTEVMCFLALSAINNICYEPIRWSQIIV